MTTTDYQQDLFGSVTVVRQRLSIEETFTAFCRRMEIIWASEPDATLIVAENRQNRYWLGIRRDNRDPVWVQHDGMVAA